MPSAFCFLLSAFCFLPLSIFAQNRSVARGATPGELYLADFWYDVFYAPFGDTLQAAIYHITENGKKLTIQYNQDVYADQYTESCSVNRPASILADATSGVIYNVTSCYKNDWQTQLWVSFDYGKNWMLRDEDIGSKNYLSTNFEGLIYRGGEGIYISEDYGTTFLNVEIIWTGFHERSEFGWEEEEFFSVGTISPYNGILTHTYDLSRTNTIIPIDSQYVFGQIWGIFPDVYRGGKTGEVYVSSMFPDPENNNRKYYKVSFSADTGYTFRHVYVSESFGIEHPAPLFMSDREAGVFYILRRYHVDDGNGWDWHLKLCIEYYRDYGDTHVATYCHDLTKDYGSICEAVNNLVSEKCNNNCILLTWSEPESSLPVEGYQVFRNEQLINNEQLIINNFYLDEDLPVGEYEYYVVTHYTTGCVSDTSNHVEETIELGVKEFSEEIAIFPNPTTGQLTIDNGQLTIDNVEVFDVYGRKLFEQKAEGRKQKEIDISDFRAGIYFVRIATEQGVVIKKVIKY